MFEANSYFVAQIGLELAPHALAPSQVYMDELSKRGVLEFIDLALRRWEAVVGRPQEDSSSDWLQKG